MVCLPVVVRVATILSTWVPGKEARHLRRLKWFPDHPAVPRGQRSLLNRVTGHPHLEPPPTARFPDEFLRAPNLGHPGHFRYP